MARRGHSGKRCGRRTAYRPELATDAAGNAMAVWVQSGADGGIWSSRFVAEVGWSAPVLVSTEAASSVQIAMDATGNDIAIWVRTAEREEIVWSRYLPAIGWSAALPIDAGSDDGACILEYDFSTGCQPDLAMDTSGNAIAVWLGTDLTVRASRYSSEGSWGAVERFDRPMWSADSPRVAVTPSGDATLVWRETDENRGIHVWARRYAIGDGWKDAEQLSNGESMCPPLALHGLPSGCEPEVAGNATIVWHPAAVCMPSGFATVRRPRSTRTDSNSFPRHCNRKAVA